MNGIYIHIPYCKKACNYCDFHFSASLKNKDQMIDSICYEAFLQKDYLHGIKIDTLYFGGGTPSLLTLSELEKIISQISRFFMVNELQEFTVEVNPDDVSSEYLNGLQSMGVNRLSIGIQSFLDADLLWMNRRHNSVDAIRSVKLAQDVGFNNINIDLIYGLPGSSMQTWEQNLQTFFSLHIPHLSAYHLSIEPKTILGVWKNKGKVQEISEDESIEQYKLLLELTQSANYLNYEISNFCCEGFYSKHNMNYWNQGLYLGLGPSAHSYNGISRQWNVSVNQAYINKLENKETWFEKEELSCNDRYNDYILTRLRTIWGINPKEIKEQFGEQFYKHIQKEQISFFQNGLLEMVGETIRLTDKGKFLANRIISGLMF